MQKCKKGWDHLKFFSRTIGPEKLIFTQKLSHLMQIQFFFKIMIPGGMGGTTIGKIIFTCIQAN
jgi:hypothetical protein